MAIELLGFRVPGFAWYDVLHGQLRGCQDEGALRLQVNLHP